MHRIAYQRLNEKAAVKAVAAQNEYIDHVSGSLREDPWQSPPADGVFDSLSAYESMRTSLVEREKVLNFDAVCRLEASPLETQVDAIIQRARRIDDRNIYGTALPRKGHGGQQHSRFAGDHFLSNADLINRTALFDIAQRMPKGCHLHIHFNACLSPQVLLHLAKSMDRMFITSDVPLVPSNDCESFQQCEIQFSILTPEKERPGNLFSPDYQPRQTMRFLDFLEQFPQHYEQGPAEKWLVDKLEFQEVEAYNLLQTADGAWEKFNGRTRMMKGLFNYETAYRRYTRLFLEDLLRDNISYAEIRPNFMTTNQLWTDDGRGRIDNRGIIKLIIDEVLRFRSERPLHCKFFSGVKIIYCTPRVFKPTDVKVALDECIAFKKEWPEWIAGFDLMGEESKGKPLKAFLPELIEFRKRCSAENLDIPFLFHCGETLEMGTDTDQNLVDALLLGSRRIGHGFALSRHPYIMQQMKARNVCLETCPISNEVLGLTPRVSGHAMYQLLADNLHCTVNSDNGTLFKSTLSHDFYQVMVGKSDMGLFGWKQLVLWSIEHACLSDSERQEFFDNWQHLWKTFLDDVVRVYGHLLLEDVDVVAEFSSN